MPKNNWQLKIAPRWSRVRPVDNQNFYIPG